MSSETGTTTRQRVRVTVAGDALSATLILFRPGKDDPKITLDEVMKEVNKAGVVYGLDQEKIDKMVAEEDFNNPTRIADGFLPKRGKNSEFTYNFDTSAKLTPKEDDDGLIDYKDINFIQNTEKGTVLVTKTPPTQGVPGMTVKGKELKGLDGRDLPFKNGTNTKVSDDGLELVATASGSIVYLHGKVSVNPLTIISGDVDFNIGNIDCRGSVRVGGDVKAGFKIKVDGDLEVTGNVEDCEIEVGGNIMIKGGYFGKSEGQMQAEGDIVIKYSEGQKIIGSSIYVGSELINCHVEAKEKVWVKGRKGKIVGGEIRAGKEIRASVFGSEAGTSTVVDILMDAELIRKHQEIVNEIARLKEDNDRVKQVMVSLYRQQLDNKLTPDKRRVLEKFEVFKKELPENLERLNKKKTEIEEELKKYSDTRIIVEEKIFPGVKACFGIVYREFFEETNRGMLTLEGSSIIKSEFRE